MKGLVIFLVLVAACLAKNEVAAPRADPAIEFIKGFLEGIHETKPVEDLLKCLKNIDPIIEKIKKALEYFMKMTFNDILKGLQLLKEAMEDLYKVLQPCLEGFKQIKKLMEALKNVDLVKIVLKILANPLAFINDVKNCIEALKNLNMFVAGKCIGDILYRLFLARELQSSPIIDFVTGFLLGIHEERTVEDVIKCMKNADQILDKIKIAIKMIVSGNIDNIIKGISMLFEALLELEQMLKPCLEGFVQFKKLMNKIAHAKIMDVVMKILQDPAPYMEDFFDCLDALENEDFKQAGQDIGDILYRLFLVDVNVDEMTFNDIVAILKGLLHGINQGQNIGNVETCLMNIPTLIDSIKELVELVKNIDWKNLDKLVEALKKVFKIMELVLDGIKPCSLVPKEIDEIIKKLSEIDSKKLLEKVLKNAFKLINDITAAIKALTKADYYEFGYKLGDIVFFLLLKD